MLKYVVHVQANITPFWLEITCYILGNMVNIPYLMVHEGLNDIMTHAYPVFY